MLLTGTVGSGKTALAVEVGAVLGRRDVGVAVVDLDWLGWVHGAHAEPSDLILDNLEAILPNFLSAGVTRFVLVRMIRRRAETAALKKALGDGSLTVVRVAAAPDVIEQRLRRRDTGAELEEHLVEHSAMTAALDEARLEDIRVENDHRPISEVAAELVDRLGWR